MDKINYRQQWADGEIEAGTLLDAIDELMKRLEQADTVMVPRELLERIRSFSWHGDCAANAGVELDLLLAGGAK